jgi:tRNA 2-thiouridine synthesizing protein A
MTKSSPSPSPPISSSPGDAGSAATKEAAEALDPRDAMRGRVNGLEEDSQVGAELSGAGPRDATRGGVNGPASPAHRGQESPLSIDLRGEICPFTFVRTKLALEELPVGAVLRVTVDHEPAIRNIPRSATEWGQEVVGVSCVAPRTWAIDLRKRVR